MTVLLEMMGSLITLVDTPQTPLRAEKSPLFVNYTYPVVIDN